ncbi:MAG: efflux RND transporter periplasmic adaptor subunit [Gammaproteobacteria bacterium]
MKTANASRVALPILVITAGLLIGAYLVASRPTAQPNPPVEKITPVSVLTAQFITFQPELHVYGQITAGREAEIRSMVAGRITLLDEMYRSGAYVETGQPFVQIDRFDYEVAVRELQADLDESRAHLAELESDLDAARSTLKLLLEQSVLRERDLERVAKLTKKSQSSEKAYDDAQIALNSAAQQRVQGRQQVDALAARIRQQQAAVARNEARLDRANRDLADTTITAPFSGYLQDVNLATGKRVAVGESLGRLIDAQGLEVRFELPNADYARLVGVVETRLDAGRHPLSDTRIAIGWRLGDEVYEYQGRVERAGAEIDSTSGGVVLFGRVTHGPVGILRPGAFVEITVPGIAYESVLVLPESAVSDENIIYIVRDERLVPVQVKVLREFGDEFIVTGDIAPQAVIVAEQFPTIGPGVAVRPM